MSQRYGVEHGSRKNFLRIPYEVGGRAVDVGMLHAPPWNWVIVMAHICRVERVRAVVATVLNHHLPIGQFAVAMAPEKPDTLLVRQALPFEVLDDKTLDVTFNALATIAGDVLSALEDPSLENLYSGMVRS